MFHKSGKISKLLVYHYTLIYRYLTCCHQVWRSTYQHNIDTLGKIQKKTVRIMCSANSYFHTEKLYDELKILKIRNIYCYLFGQLMFRFYHKLLPRIFDEYFVQHDVFHTYDTRNALLHRLPTGKHMFQISGKFSRAIGVLYIGISIFNILPSGSEVNVSVQY